MKCPFATLRTAYQQDGGQQVLGGVENGEPSCPVGGTRTGAAPVESSVEAPGKIKNGTTM